MQKKILGIMVCMLCIFSASVVASVGDKLEAPINDDNTVNNSTWELTFMLTGILFDKKNTSENHFRYTVLLGYLIVLEDGHYSDSNFILYNPIHFAYDSKTGVLRDHFVCATFFNVTWA